MGHLIKRYSLLLMLVALFSLSRLLILVNALDSFYTEEHLTQGILARDVIDGEGLRVNILDYRRDRRSGVDFVHGILFIPFFLISGESYFAHMIFIFIWRALIFVLIYLFLKENFGTVAALIGSYLTILAPAGLVTGGPLEMEASSSAFLFNLLVLFLFYKIILQKQQGKNYSSNTLVFFGLVNGLGIFYIYSHAIVFFCCLLCWVIIDKKILLKRDFLKVMLSFLIGFSPWILYHLHLEPENTFAFENFLFNSIAHKTITDIFHNFNNAIYGVRNLFIASPLPTKLSFIDYINLKLGLHYSMFYLFLISIVFLCLKNVFFLLKRKSEFQSSIKELLLVILVMLYLFAYCIYYKQDIDYLYFLVPLAIFMISITVSQVYSFIINIKPNFLRRIILSSVVPLTLYLGLIIGVSNYRECLHPFSPVTVRENLKNIFRYRSYSTLLNYSFKFRWEDNVDLGVNLLEGDHIIGSWLLYNQFFGKFEDIFLLFTGFVERGELFRNSIENNTTVIDKLDNNLLKAYCYYILGESIGLRFGQNLQLSTDLINTSISEEFKSYCYEGLAYAFMDSPFRRLLTRLEQIKLIPQEYRHYFYIALGQRVNRRDWVDIQRSYYFVRKFDREFLIFFYQGLFTSLDREKTEQFLAKQRINRRHLIYFYQRLGLSYSNDYFDTSMNTMNEEYQPFFYQGLFRNLFLKRGLLISASSFEEFLSQKELLTLLDSFTEDNPRYNLKALYLGLGIELGIDTFGYIKGLAMFLQALEDKGVQEDFYYGYGIGLSLRYGKNLEIMKRFIHHNVPAEFKGLSLEAIEDYSSILLLAENDAF